ncbi:hypothetical protein EDB80DRAFT_683264 [Ilyonectria destructans]|nr:hypothetical protein EDB80DRAFT_683264 [Ilyonectria destructans]
MTVAALMPAPGLVGDRPSRNTRCRSRRADEIRHSLGFGVRRKEEGGGRKGCAPRVHGGPVGPCGGFPEIMRRSTGAGEWWRFRAGGDQPSRCSAVSAINAPQGLFLTVFDTLFALTADQLRRRTVAVEPMPRKPPPRPYDSSRGRQRVNRSSPYSITPTAHHWRWPAAVRVLLLFSGSLFAVQQAVVHSTALVGCQHEKTGVRQPPHGAG